jgi:hypothetical protein
MLNFVLQTVTLYIFLFLHSLSAGSEFHGTGSVLIQEVGEVVPVPEEHGRLMNALLPATGSGGSLLRLQVPRTVGNRPVRPVRDGTGPARYTNRSGS